VEENYVYYVEHLKIILFYLTNLSTVNCDSVTYQKNNYFHKIINFNLIGLYKNTFRI